MSSEIPEIKSDNNIFRDYLHKEYSYIAEAHFKTIETISTFFKHYLAIMTIPIILIGYLFAKKENIDLFNSIPELNLYGGLLLTVISFVGCAVMLYIINLRHDALLYARAVNGIRKYFYDRAEIDLNIKLRMRTLPQTTGLPSYFEGRYFLPVIFTFAIFDSFYLTSGYIAVMTFFKIDYLNYAILSILSFLSLHFLLYLSYSKFRELGYLKSNIIGIDIDGVLNKHRDHFCKLINEKTDKVITPDQITHIPVHELGLTTADEDNEVFNDPKYWMEMPLEDDSPKNMKKLRNIFKLKVLIFTSRGWPNVTLLSRTEKKMVFRNWRCALSDYEKNVSGKISKKLFILFYYKLRNHFRKNKNIINRLTELWLRLNNIEFDKLIIEKGNENATDPRGHFYNRFNFSRKKKIKYFVEDDLEKAIKLAFICDVVFLFGHPYNEFRQFADTTIPTNIIRVDSWNDIYRNIRIIS